MSNAWPLKKRLMAKVEKQPGRNGCWLFTGHKTYHGYGLILCQQRKMRAHRASYELFVGDVPEGLELDHLCRVRNCVRPDHLEPVTHAENLRRGIEARRREAAA